jgi:PAS domain S-box-containing protein
LIVVPLIKNGQLVATLATNQHTPRNWTTDEITAVQETAERTWAAVERAYAEAALRESEEKYRSLFTTMDQGFCIIEKVETAPGQPSNFRYITVNPAFERHTGLSDVVGKTMRDFVPNAEHHLVDIYDAVVRTGEPQHFEEYVSEVDLWFETEVFPAQLPGQIAVLFSNVSDRKRAELALRESEERLRDVLNSMSEGFALLGGDFTILDVNEETLRLDGRSRHELIGRSHWEAFPGSENSPVGEIFKRVARERRPDSLEHEYYWSDRRSLWIDMRAYPTRDTGVAIFWRDITDRKKTEAALRESEAKYRSLFTSMDEGYFLCEVIFDENHQPVDLFYIDENPAAIRVTGQSFRGRRLREIDPNYEEYWYEIFGRVAQSGQGERLERYAEPDQIWYDFYVFKVGSEESRRVAVVFNDITDRKRSEAQLQRAAERDAFRVKLSDALRSLTDPVQIQAEACRLLGEQLGVDRAFYVEIYEAEGYARVNQHYSRGDSPSIVGDYPLAGYGWSMQIMRRGETIVVADTQSSNLVPDAERAAMAMLQMVGFVALPLIKGEVLVGALTLNEPAPREWTEAEVELVRETAERIWADIQRAHAETALRQSEEKYRTLFDSIDEGLAIVEMIYDDQGEIVDIIYRQVNRAYERHGGVYNVVGRSIFDVIPGVEDYWLDLYKRVAKTGESVREENYQQDVDRWFDVYFSRVDDSGRFVAIVFSDISDRKQRERQQEYLLKLSDTLRPLVEAEEIETSACRVLGEWLGAHRVYYVEIFESEGVGRVSKQYLRNGAASIAGDYPIAAFDWTAQALRRGEAVVVSDVYHSDLVPPESIAAMEAVQQISIVLVPLIKEGKWVGVLTVGKDAPRDWREEDVELVRETLERMWAAAQRARAEAALRELELQRVREQSAREQERQRAEALAELDRAKTVFFSNISHEFRTPLTLLLAPLQDALKSVDEWMSGSVDETPSTHRPIHPSTLKHNLELVHRNSLRLLKLVNTLLDFSRIEAGRRSAVYEPTDLATYTAELASVFRSAIERAGLQLMVDCPPLPEPVFVDREMWEKIVLNLLSNAFKFTFEGEIRVSLRVGAWESGSVDETPSTHQPIHPSTHAILQIQDTGTGITPEHLPHLFERFYQVRGNQARTHEGSGIGLALVNELVRLQGGTIEVSSILGEGTCFTVSLPFGTEHLPSDRLQSEGDRHPIRTLASTAMSATAYVEEAERWLPTLDPPQPPLEGGENLLKVPLNKEDLGGSLGAEADSTSSARVLVVDDNADMREYLTRILSEYVQVEAVADGITALAAAQERVPDLILSDVMMPGLDGFELLEALRADPRTREIPIILLSARAGEEAIVEGLAAGADDYLIKPFSAQELISRIIAHLQMAQLRGEALQEARSTLRSRDEFISVVSHELNTPLVSILGWTRMLRSSLPNPVILSKALDTIERNATLQAKLVQDLLDLSRISAGKLRLNPQPIELKPVIETAIATVSQTAIDKGIHLTRQENVTEPVVVKGDSDRLCQVLINLLTNAIKFTPESGSVTLELSVKCGSVDENPSTHPPIHPSTHPPIHSYAEIRVTDTGDGIPADFLPYVFERFRQAEGAYAAKGLGLGLAIARHIVELHNGTIHAESAGEEQGATFIVRLPLLQKNDDFSGIQPGI